jgi:hypothetical protein
MDERKISTCALCRDDYYADELNEYLFCLDCDSALRSMGWRHETDVVEGRTVRIPCPRCHGRHACFTCQEDNRPATIADLLKP